MNLGAHMPIAGGIQLSLERGKRATCSVVQIFTRNQMQWKAPPLKEEEVEAFKRMKKSFFSVYAHASYLINLASPEDELYHKSIDALVLELERCRTLELPLLVIHPGSHRGSGETSGIERIARAIREAYDRFSESTVTLLLETTSGQGNIIGYRFEHLRDIIASSGEVSDNIGICIDTCHIFAAGYPFSTPDEYERLIATVARTVGIERVMAIHTNDSVEDLGSHRDRHQHIGKGKIGLDAFRNILTDPFFGRIPMNLETPKGKDMREDIDNLSLLRKLRSGKPGNLDSYVQRQVHRHR